MADRRALTSWENAETPFSPPGLTLTRRFYAWEVRGRGWHLWPGPVQLEPPFVEFRHLLRATVVADDGRMPGIAERVASVFRGSSPITLPAVVTTPEEEFSGEASVSTAPEFVELSVAVPKTVFGSRDMVEQFLLVSTAAGALGFEIVGTQERIVLQLVATKKRAHHVREQLKGHFPGVVVTETLFLSSAWANIPGDSLVVDFGLSQEFMRPLKTSNFTPDPLVAIISALEGLGEGEIGVFQVLCERVKNSWAESILRAVTGAKGESFIAECPEMVALAKEKVRGTMFAAVVRVAAKAESDTRRWRIVQGLGAALAPTANPGSNELMPLTNDGFPGDVHEEDLLLRTSHRCGMLLSSAELMTLVHLPTPAVASRTLARVGKKTAPAPKIAKAVDCLLGMNVHEGSETPVGLSNEQRLQHLYCVGGSGTGKSTLLRNLVLQDVLAGRGCAVLDPHGDLVDDVLRHIPAERAEDVILFDPADTECPVGFNVLQAHTELEKNLLASDLVSVFRRFSTSWGDQMSTVLGNAIIALLESPRGGTLADLRRFLIEKEFRRSVLQDVSDPEVRYWWEKQFPLLKGTPYASVLTRLDAFLRPKPVRYVVSQRDATLDISSVMSEGKIFLGKLAGGLIGEENAHLLGSLIVSKFHQCALARQAESPEARKPFFLFVDEFHHFVSPSMAAILQGARKYRLGLTLANQELRAVAERDRELLASVLSNAYTRVMFRVGDDDAKKLADGLSSFDAKDLQNLGRGEAIVRVERSDGDCNITTLAPADPAEDADETVRAIIELSRARYGRVRSEIEAELALQYGAPAKGKERQSAGAQDTSADGEAAPASADHLPGKGGAEHKRLQQLIKRLGEERGFKATIEKQVLEGAGSIDVALERDSELVAFEVSISTGVEHEMHNISKCIDAGASKVVVVSPDLRHLRAIQNAIERAISKEKLGAVSYVSPEELPMMFDTLGSTDKTRGQVRGWKVNVNFEPRSGTGQKDAKQGIAQTILTALRRVKCKE